MLILSYSLMISLDGSFGEGGGQILRTALALSMLTQQEFELKNIRAKRLEKGLKAQHLAAVLAAQSLCGAEVKGAGIGSAELFFSPRKITRNLLDLDISTAGSITLLMQAILLPCFFSRKIKTLRISGGTDVQWSPQINYFQEVFVPQIMKYCKSIDVKLLKRGYYPAGGGSVELTIKPKFCLEDCRTLDEVRSTLLGAPIISLVSQGSLMFIKGISHASAELENAKVAERQAASAESVLKKLFGHPVNIRCEYSKSESIGSGIVLWAVFSAKKDDIDIENPVIIGADQLGIKGVPAEQIGRFAAEKLVQNINSNCALDGFLADQLVPWIALLKNSKIAPKTVTNHAVANIYVTEKFFGKCLDADEKYNIITSF